MNAKVREYFDGLPPSALASLEGATDVSSFSAADLTSLDQIDELPSDVQELVRNAFRNGVRWTFISLIPWACASFNLGCMFLKNIADSDRVRISTSPETAAGDMQEREVSERPK